MFDFVVSLRADRINERRGEPLHTNSEECAALPNTVAKIETWLGENELHGQSEAQANERGRETRLRSFVVYSPEMCFCRYRNRRHVRHVGRMATHVGPGLGARAHGADVVRRRRINHHHIAHRHDFVLDRPDKSVSFRSNILHVQRLGRRIHFRMAHYVLRWLHGLVRLLRGKKSTLDIRLQSAACIGGNQR